MVVGPGARRGCIRMRTRAERVPGACHRASLDAAGHVLAATAPPEYVPKPLRALIEGSASRAAYHPASVDGRTVPAELWVTAVTRIEFDEDGDMTARVTDVVGGGGLGSESTWLTPTVPGATGSGADVLATVVFGVDGRADADASRVDVERSWEDGDRPDDGERRLRRERRYSDAVRTGLRRWRWTPDTVDGAPVRGEFTVALHFASKGDRMDRDWTPPPVRPAVFRPLPEAGIVPAALVSWAPARSAAAPVTE